MRNVQTTTRYIRRYQNRTRLGFVLIQCTKSFRLAHLSMQGYRVKTKMADKEADTFDVVASATEY